MDGRGLPTEVRDALARDPDAKVLESIAPHPGLSEAQLRAMVALHGVRVIAKVAANPDATSSLLEDLVEHRPPVQKAFREVARHRNATAAALLACLTDRQARPWAASHRTLPPSIIVELLDDEDWQVVQAAAADPSLPYAAMSGLCLECSGADHASIAQSDPRTRHETPSPTVLSEPSGYSSLLGCDVEHPADPESVHE